MPIVVRETKKTLERNKHMPFSISINLIFRFPNKLAFVVNSDHLQTRKMLFVRTQSWAWPKLNSS